MRKFLTAAQTGFVVIAIIALIFTACNKGKSAADGFSIYGIWQYTGGADTEHGETWTGDGQRTMSFFKDGENVIYTSSQSEDMIWQGVLNDNGNFHYSFNPHTCFDLNTKTFYDFEAHGPSAWLVIRYDSENKRLVTSDHTVEEYYEWADKSSRIDLSGFAAGTQQPAVDLSGFAGMWVNNAGNKIELKTDGTFVMHQSGSSWENEITGGFKQIDNFYSWAHPAGDFGIYLVPVGVDFILNGKVFQTNNSKDRLITEDLHSDPVVYYREGEASSAVTVTHPIINISDKLNGETINVTVHCSPVIRNSDDQIIGYSIDRLVLFYDGKEHSLFTSVDREDEPVYFTKLGAEREFSITTYYDYNSDGYNDIGVHNIDPFSETYREMHAHFLYDPRTKSFHRDNKVRCSFYAQ